MLGLPEMLCVLLHTAIGDVNAAASISTSELRLGLDSIGIRLIVALFIGKAKLGWTIGSSDVMWIPNLSSLGG